jgi:hypothetical protein
MISEEGRAFLAQIEAAAMRAAAHLREMHADCPDAACGLKLITTEDVQEVALVFNTFREEAGI